MKKKRMSPYELEENIFEAVESRRWLTRQSWREVHKEALLLWVDKHKDVASVTPSHGDTGDSCANALTVERLPVQALPASQAAVEVVPELTDSEARLARLIKRRGDKVACFEAAQLELAQDPKSLRANNLVARMPKAIAEYDADIAEWTAKVAAERALSIKTVDNSENGGEV